MDMTIVAMNDIEVLVVIEGEPVHCGQQLNFTLIPKS